MGPELDKKVLPVRSPDSLEATINVDVSRDVSGVLYNSEAKLMQCMNNCEEGYILASCEVDITDCGSSPNSGQLEDCPEDVTEYSSSFGDTDPGTIIYSGVSDGEVESTYSGLVMSGSFNKGYGDLFALRNKKLTDHWRVFIQPLQWHCKWLELQMKESNVQAIKYENTLAEYAQKKHLGIESLNCGHINYKSATYLALLKRERVMNRRKRKRKEDVDLTFYMSHHNVFSFYDKKPV